MKTSIVQTALHTNRLVLLPHHQHARVIPTKVIQGTVTEAMTPKIIEIHETHQGIIPGTHLEIHPLTLETTEEIVMIVISLTVVPMTETVQVAPQEAQEDLHHLHLHPLRQEEETAIRVTTVQAAMKEIAQAGTLPFGIRGQHQTRFGMHKDVILKTTPLQTSPPMIHLRDMPRSL